MHVITFIKKELTTHTAKIMVTFN